MSTQPRVVLVTRPTPYTQLIARHGTRDQARFFLETRERSIDDLHEQHDRFEQARQVVTSAIPADWRRSAVERADLDRFLFEPGDIVVVLGQDGLVANLSKYLDGQPVIGLDPDPGVNAGVLVPHPPSAAQDLMHMVAAGRASLECRTMVQARLDDGQALTALNEIFIGHQTHQSARYRIQLDSRIERQSSSGVVVSTGTGSTGWASSIYRERASSLSLPQPADGTLCFFVREAWPSVSTSTGLTEGLIKPGATLTIMSEMEQAGVVFGDGIEDDRLEFGWGRRLEVSLSDQRLNLVQAA